MPAFSLLDLVPIAENGTISDAFSNAVNIARHAEFLGFKRYWVAEHHGIAGIASAATSIVIGHIAAATDRIRVGAGGIMMPNHAPLIIAEQFGTLDALYPDRIDLGLGRAPGSDGRVAVALRRNLNSDPDAFPKDVIELQSYFADDGKTGITAVPGGGANVPLYILGSSLYGAHVAAALGLPYAFASHFAPQMLDDALSVYRRNFRPSAALSQPYAMITANIIAADSDEEAIFLASTLEQSFIRLRRAMPGKIPPPVENFRATLPAAEQHMLQGIMQCSAIGSPDSVRTKMADIIDRTAADEIIIACSIFDQEKRKVGLNIAAEILGN